MKKKKKVTGITFSESIPIKGIPNELKQQFLDEKISWLTFKRIVRNTKIAKAELSITETKIEKKLTKKYKDKFWTKKLDLKRLRYDITKEEGGNLPLKKVRIDETYFKDEKEARDFAKRCGGRFVKLEKFWVLKIDPYLLERIEKAEKEKKKKVQLRRKA